jgi:hypothetical protein
LISIASLSETLPLPFYLKKCETRGEKMPVFKKEREHILSKKSEKARKTALIASQVKRGLLFPL